MNKKDKVASKNIESSKRKEMANNKKAQTRKMKEEIGNMEGIEDTTKYGEFMSSYFAWMNLEEQKKNAERLGDITDSK